MSIVMLKQDNSCKEQFVELIFDPVKNKMDRYEAALLIIANKLHTCGTSMLWVEMQNVARYALTGEENDSNWSVSKLDMDAIDKAGKL